MEVSLVRIFDLQLHSFVPSHGGSSGSLSCLPRQSKMQHEKNFPTTCNLLISSFGVRRHGCWDIVTEVKHLDRIPVHQRTWRAVVFSLLLSSSLNIR